MYFIDGKESTVLKLVVGTGGIKKGDLCVITSETVVKAAAAPTAATVIGIAVADAVATAMGLVEVCGERIIRSAYTTADSALGTNKIFDLSDEKTVKLDDTSGGCCFCVGYDKVRATVDFVVTAAARII